MGWQQKPKLVTRVSALSVNLVVAFFAICALPLRLDSLPALFALPLVILAGTLVDIRVGKTQSALGGLAKAVKPQGKGSLHKQ